MKVKMLVAMDRKEDPFTVGQVVEVPEQLGVLYIQAGYAVAVAGEVHADPNLPESPSGFATGGEFTVGGSVAVDAKLAEFQAGEAVTIPAPVPPSKPPVRQAASKPKD